MLSLGAWNRYCNLEMYISSDKTVYFTAVYKVMFLKQHYLTVPSFIIIEFSSPTFFIVAPLVQVKHPTALSLSLSRECVILKVIDNVVISVKKTCVSDSFCDDISADNFDTKKEARKKRKIIVSLL